LRFGDHKSPSVFFPTSFPDSSFFMMFEASRHREGVKLRRTSFSNWSPRAGHVLPLAFFFSFEMTPPFPYSASGPDSEGPSSWNLRKLRGERPASLDSQAPRIFFVIILSVVVVVLSDGLTGTFFLAGREAENWSFPPSSGDIGGLFA